MKNRLIAKDKPAVTTNGNVRRIFSPTPTSQKILDSKLMPKKKTNHDVKTKLRAKFAVRPIGQDPSPKNAAGGLKLLSAKVTSTKANQFKQQ